MLSKLKKQRDHVGIEISSDSIAIAVSTVTDNKKTLKSVFVLEKDTQVGLPNQLAEFVEKHALSQCYAHILLTGSEYEVVLADAAEVAAAELREAMRWKVKDLISIPLEQAAIDVFPLPEDGVRSGKKMAYVVATKKDLVKSYIDLIEETGLKLASIDIEEMALRNLSLYKSEGEESRGVALIHLGENSGSVSLYRNGNLYLSRRFALNYGAGLLDDIPGDQLALEVQRSLDYYERQMGMVPPMGLFVCGENISSDKVTTEIRRSMTVQTHYLDLIEMLSLNANDIDESILQRCVGAVGAALRLEDDV